MATTLPAAAYTFFRLTRFMKKAQADPNRFAYTDAAIAPIGEETVPLPPA